MTTNKKFAFVVVVNKKYLVGFHVLIYSLRRKGILEFCDVVAVSTEGDLKNDIIVKKYVNQFIHVSEADINSFAMIPSDGVREHLREKNIAKYNFLKFYCFNDYGYDYNILIDCDIVCMNKFHPDDFAGDFDVAVTPRFSPAMYPGDAFSEISQDKTVDAIEDFYRNYEKLVTGYGINSGVLVVGKNFMNRVIFREMISLASTMKAGGDQSVIWKYINSKDVCVKVLHPKFNFNQHCLGHLQVSEQVKWMATAVFLHFPGSYPWDADQTAKKLSHSAWHQAKKEADRWKKSLELE